MTTATAPKSMSFESFQPKKATYPAYAQPKLLHGTPARLTRDGFVLANNRVANKLAHISEALYTFMTDDADVVIDGLLVIPGATAAETLAILRMRNPVPATTDIVFYAYDIQSPNLNFTERHGIISEWVKSTRSPYLRTVKLIPVKSESKLRDKIDKLNPEEYSGLIVRAGNGMYVPGAKSADNLFYEIPKTDVFKVIASTEGAGKEKGQVVWICDAGGKLFSVTPKGSAAQRKAMYANRETYIGRDLHITHQGIAKDGVPVSPVGIDFV